MPTYFALIALSTLILTLVTLLVRRDRRERDEDRRLLARTVAKLARQLSRRDPNREAQ